MSQCGRSLSLVGVKPIKREEAVMNKHINCDCYRQNWELFKVLIGTNLILLKFLLVWVRICIEMTVR